MHAFEWSYNKGKARKTTTTTSLPLPGSRVSVRPGLVHEQSSDTVRTNTDDPRLRRMPANGETPQAVDDRPCSQLLEWYDEGVGEEVVVDCLVEDVETRIILVREGMSAPATRETIEGERGRGRTEAEAKSGR